MILTHAEHNSLYLAKCTNQIWRSHYPWKFEILETTLMRWAQRHTDIAAREGRGVGGTQQILYTIFHNFVYLLLTNGTPFTYLAYNFVSVLTAGNPHCHKIGISHKYRTLSRRVRSWTSGRSLPYKYLLSTVQCRKWSRDRKWSPKWTANDPRPKVIPKVDLKWSRENLGNGIDFIGLIITKKPFSLAF